MKTEDCILCEIEYLKAERYARSLSGSDEDRLACLEVCYSILMNGRVLLRPLVREVVAGRMGEVAKTVGVRRATLSVYLKGATSLSSDTVEAILRLPR